MGKEDPRRADGRALGLMPLGIVNRLPIETADHPELLGRALHTAVTGLELRAENMGRAVDWREFQVSVRWFKGPQTNPHLEGEEYECLIVEAEVPFIRESEEDE